MDTGPAGTFRIPAAEPECPPIEEHTGEAVKSAGRSACERSSDRMREALAIARRIKRSRADFTDRPDGSPRRNTDRDSGRHHDPPGSVPEEPAAGSGSGPEPETPAPDSLPRRWLPRTAASWIHGSGSGSSPLPSLCPVGRS